MIEKFGFMNAHNQIALYDSIEEVVRSKTTPVEIFRVKFESIGEYEMHIGYRKIENQVVADVEYKEPKLKDLYDGEYLTPKKKTAAEKKRSWTKQPNPTHVEDDDGDEGYF